jgi:hypothetical protein
VKPNPEFNRTATECLPPTAFGALAGPRGAAVGAANCAYDKATGDD